ncbi:MAG: DUF2272 domain-containing protein [Acetobacteraceae bacterium]
MTARPSPRRMRRLAAAMAAALFAAGCAAVPPAVQPPPIPYPASARERLVRIALAEWEEWGRQFTDHTGRMLGAPAQEGRTEDMIDAFPALIAYWSAVPGREETIERNIARLRSVEATAAASAPLWTDVPWSAAFLSFALRSAGYAAADVPATDAHWVLVDHLAGRAGRFPGRAPFVPHDPADYAPRPGDLLCATRAGARFRYASPEDRAREAGRAVPMHCDIVVSAREGVVEAIGGNLGDAVRMSLLPADGGGRLVATAPPGAPTPPAWFVVFENRAGRTARTAAADTGR